jgi:hypothetical protein
MQESISIVVVAKDFLAPIASSGGDGTRGQTRFALSGEPQSQSNRTMPVEHFLPRFKS